MKQAVAGIVAGLMALTSAVPSVNAATPYVTCSLGVAVQGDSELTPRTYDTGYALFGAIGLDDGQHRFEGELGHQNNGVKNTDMSVSMTTWMGNGYIDLKLPYFSLKPFVMAGVGLANVDEDNGHGNIVGDTVFAWQFGGGAGIRVAPQTTLDAQYRYLATSTAELAGNKAYSIGTHHLTLGLRVDF